jgi:carboxypeptidase family protein/TonB-dependent receptor-like protein
MHPIQGGKDRGLPFLFGCLALALLATLLPPRRALAQVLYGSIVGNVTDSSGAPIPGATVTIINNETNQSREAVTSTSGSYDFTTLQTGTYTVKLSQPGFKTLTRSDVAVRLNNVTRLDLVASVGEVSETVVVTAEPALLKTDRAEISAELTTRPLQDLPVTLGRNYQSLFRTLPGITPPENAHSIPSNPSRSLVFNVNGASRSSNNTRIDGASTTNIWLPHVTAYVPALESIETVNVVTNSFDAEQGLAGGAAINVQIRSGSNELHGSAFEYHNNQHMNARNFFLPRKADGSLQDKGKVVYNQYGGTLGGPLRKDKLFFFISYEGTKDRRYAERSNLTVPGAAIRTGDFRSTGVTIYDPFDASGNLVANPADRKPVSCNGVVNVICPNRISPISQRIINLIPAANSLGANPEVNNYFAAASFIFDRQTLDTKLTWSATPKVNVFGRFSMLDFYTFNQPTFNNELQGFPIAGGNPGTGTGKTYVFSLGGVYTVASNLVVDGHFGFVRQIAEVEQPDIGKSTSEILGIPIPGMNGSRPFEGGIGRFSVGGYETYGQTENYMPYYRSDDQFQYVVNANWLLGRHNIRFGTDVYLQQLNHTQPETTGTSYGARGGFTFGNGPTRIPSVNGTQFHSWAAFLLGLPTELGRLSENVAPYTTRNKAFSVYVRDQWQITPRLTLSYGTRWEYFPVPTRADRGLERYNTTTNKMEIGGIGSVPMDLGVKVSRSLFAPRLGVAWRPTEKLVVRAGYGLSNDPYALARPMRTNHPILTNLVVPSDNFFWVRSASGALIPNRFAEGIPPVPAVDVGNGILDMPPNVSVVTLPDEFDRGYIQSWNLSLQRELWGGFTGEIAYVGTRQVRQLGFRELNWSPVGGGQAGRQLNTPAFNRRTAQTQVVAPVGDSDYKALQARLSRRFRDGWQLDVNYTLSKSMSDSGQPDSDNRMRINIPEFLYLNRSLSAFDRTHNLQISNIVELPFGRGRRWLNQGGLLAWIAGGWQVNNIVSVMSGTPFSVTADGASLNAPESDQRADLLTDNVRIIGGIGRGNPYFDPLAFGDPATTLRAGQFRFGSADWNLLRGPGIVRWDLGLFREFHATDRVTVQFRMECFNCTNTPHFNNPGSSNSTNRSQLQLNPDGTIRNLNGFAEITGTRPDFPERQVRVGLRFGF